MPPNMKNVHASSTKITIIFSLNECDIGSISCRSARGQQTDP
jgi:hypothetical protein